MVGVKKPVKAVKRPVTVKKPVVVKKPKQAVKKPHQAVKKPLSVTTASLLVEPSPIEPKSGCLWCPLFPFASIFPNHDAEYGRDAQKIVDKESDPHTPKHCNLSDTWEPVDVLYVMDQVRGNEDRQGRALSTQHANMISTTLESIDPDNEVSYAFTNVVRCRTPMNRKASNTIIKSCAYELIREIRARSPKVVVVMGGAALEYLTGETGITTLAGRVMRNTHPDIPEDTVIYAALSPQYVERFDHEIERFISMLTDTVNLVRGVYEDSDDGAGEYFVMNTVKEVEDLLEKCREVAAEGKPIAFDTETGCLNPFVTGGHPQLLCFSLSFEEGSGYTIPYLHKDSPFHAFSFDDLDKLLSDFFSDPDIPKIAQNAKFDLNHIRKALGVPVRGLIGDTMLVHSMIDETRGTHGLKTLAHHFTGMGGYEKPLDDYIAKHKEANPRRTYKDSKDKEWPGSYANIPGEILFPYAGMDTDVTLRVWNRLHEDERYTPKLQTLAETFLVKLSEVLADMEYSGAAIDPDVVSDLDVEYREVMEKSYSEIQELPTVKAFIKQRQRIKKAKGGKLKPEDDYFMPSSPKQLGELLFEYYGLYPEELTDAGMDTIRHRYRQAQERAGDDSDHVKFSSYVQQAVARKEWGLFSTKADVLHEYGTKGNEVAPLICDYRDVATLHGTFVKPLAHLLDADNRIHGTFSPWGTVTGRLASYDPNLQNIPNKGGGKIKQAYISRFGDRGFLGQVDYSQVELRFAACYFSEPEMLAAYRAGEDLHTLTAAAIYAASTGRPASDYYKLSSAEQKEWRTRAKRINFGILYGGGPAALQSTLKKDDVHVSIDECVDLVEAYFAARPVLKRGIEKLRELVKKQGYLETFTGRRRRVPEVASCDNKLVERALRQSLNFPIQSGASDMTLMSLCLIHEMMRDNDYESKMILTVHDSIIFDLVVDEALDVLSNVKNIMETLPERSDTVCPGLDWDWLTCPVVAECEMGYSWGQLVGFDPFVVSENEGIDEPLYNAEGKPREPVTIDELWELMEKKAGICA